MDLAIYQIKKDWKAVDSIVVPAGLIEYTLDLGNDVEGLLYIKRPKSNPPGWAKFFADYIDLSEFGKSASPAAILLIEVQGRWYAIPFGSGGRFLLAPDCVEERFGLLTVLNSIPDDRIRSIDKTALDARATHSRVQTNQEASASDFGIDVERDLVRAVTGTPSDQTLGLRLHGMDALRATLKIELDELPAQLDVYAKQAVSKKYKSTFAWIDHISCVSDAQLITKLDSKLLATIHENDFEKCWMAVPQMIDWGKYARFRYGGYKKKNPLHFDISLPNWIAELNEAVDGGFDATEMSLDRLNRTKVRCLDEDGHERHVWTAYKCLYAEVDHAGSSYLLSSGRWYRIAKDFVQQVNEYFEQIHRYENDLPVYRDRNEAAYNNRVCDEGNGAIALMDQKIIQYGGGPGKLEFCDLYTTSNDMIHVKRYSQSSGLSHLFSQGTVSGELFRMQADFRALVNGELPDSHKLQDPSADLEPDQYRVVYAVISRHAGMDIRLPFFSRLNLRAAATRLRGFGYRVSIAKISVDHELAITKTFL